MGQSSTDSAITASKNEPPQPCPRRYRWALRILLFVLSPLLFLGLTECALVWLDVGQARTFFEHATVNGSKVLTDNPDFSNRFFPPTLARTSQSLSFPASKDSSTFRVFVIGASAAQGDPQPAFGFSRILDVMLQERFPQRRFEIINTSIAAINSHVALPIARECARYNPDLFLIYIGHNEVIGPYGPGTVFAPFAQELTHIRANIALKGLRLSQLLAGGMQSTKRRSGVPRDWGGMSMFVKHRLAEHDARLETVYHHFEENLVAMCRAANRAGAGVLLCTLPSNERHCPPFASHYKHAPGTEARQMIEQLVADGDAHFAASRADDAVAKYDEALAIDPGIADIQFRRAKALWAAGTYDQARRGYHIARDLDTLRFRATSEINERVRRVAVNRHMKHVTLVDTEKAVAEEAPHSSPGEESFYEHVHLTFHGNYLVARELLNATARRLDAKQMESEVLAEETCRKRLAFTTWHEFAAYRETANRLSQPPFPDRHGYEAERARIDQHLDALKIARSRDAFSAPLDEYRQAIERAPRDWTMRSEFGKFLLEARFDAAVAEQQFRMVLEHQPNNIQAMNNLGLALDAQGKEEEAASYFRKALSVRPHFLTAQVNLAAIHLSRGEIESAKHLFERVLKTSPVDPVAHQGMGRIYESQGRLDDAHQHYAQSSTPAQHLTDMYNNEGLRYARAGEMLQAERYFQKALNASPASPEANGNLGNVYAIMGRLDEAAAYLEEALRLDPRVAEAHVGLGDIYFRKGFVDEAIAQYDKALTLKPNLVVAQQHRNDALSFLAEKGN